MNNREKMYVIGIDYGTDSCRAVITNAQNGEEIASAVAQYPRWTEGRYCDAANNQFRQHPQDYIDSLLAVMDELATKTGTDVLPFVRGMAIDTTGSTPCLVTEDITPLAMLPAFAENPNAMFILWKDHTATEEALEINDLAHSWKVDFTMYEGGVYSSEWLWAKLLHVARTAPEVMAAAASVIEHCDWMPALLTGVRSLGDIKRSRCAMGHKAMWHKSFGGYPSDEFLARLHPELVRIKKTLGSETWTSDTIAGYLTAEWAQRLHLKSGIPVAVGAYDAHMGAVGGGVEPGVLIKVMGTSTCDMIVGPLSVGKEHLVKGICGQVDGSIIPGMLGYEAGQSAFGDVYAWFKNILMWPIEQVLPQTSVPANIREEAEGRIMPALEKAASAIEPSASGLLALDWLNGRRTPGRQPEAQGRNHRAQPRNHRADDLSCAHRGHCLWSPRHRRALCRRTYRHTENPRRWRCRAQVSPRHAGCGRRARKAYRNRGERSVGGAGGSDVCGGRGGLLRLHPRGASCDAAGDRGRDTAGSGPRRSLQPTLPRLQKARRIHRKGVYMKTYTSHKFWFIVGSQLLYGPEALEQVTTHAKIMTDFSTRPMRYRPP